MSIQTTFGNITLTVPDGNEKRLSAAKEFIDTNNITFETARNLAVLPGFCDVHVHLRQPGFCYKETIASGTAAAKNGGYTDVCSMPNLNPVPDSVPHIAEQLRAIESDAEIRVHPYGAITVGELGERLADLDGIAEYCAAFSDDGRGVQSENMMLEAMKKAKSLGKIIAAHCEDNSLLFGGYIHDGRYAKTHGHRGISSESEWKPIARDVTLAEKTGVKYHVCHVSTAQSVEIIRKAKAEGIDITCETAPHYLVLTEADLCEDAGFKMNPPLREESDRLALIEGILDGTIDMIATDHAPHSEEEKSRGLEKSLMGVVGLETAFPIMYTKLVKTGVLELSDICRLMSENPRKRFELPEKDGEFSLWDLDCEYEIDPARFKTMGRSTPFAGTRVFGRLMHTEIKK